MLDDVGFGAPGTFGGPILTPALDLVAAQGLRYNQFHTTALCSPSRVSLLTGRNHHSAHMGGIGEIAYGFPGYDGVIPRSTATVAEVLRLHGYSTAMFGKAHVTPMWETSPAGPFDRWPTGLGFDRFYGFLGGRRPSGSRRCTTRRPRSSRMSAAPTTTSPRISLTRRSRGSASNASRRQSSPSSSTSRPAPRMRRTTCGPNGSRSSEDVSTRAGIGCARRFMPASWNWA